MLNKRTVVRMLSSYLVVLTVPLLVVYVVYNTAVSTIIASSEEQAASMLRQMEAFVDARLEELQSISQYVMDNQDIISAATSQRISPASPDIFKLYRACNSLPGYSLTNLALDDVYILLTRHQYLLSKGSAAKYTIQEHDALFAACGLDYGDFVQDISSRFYNRELLFFEGSGEGKLYLLNSMTADSYNVHAVVILQLKGDYLEGLLRDSQPYPRCHATITDAAGTVIAEYNTLNDEERRAVDEGMSLPFTSYSVFSENTGWGFHYTIPKRVIFAQTVSIKYLVAILAAGALLLGVSIGFFSTRSRASALGRILSYLSAGNIAVSGRENEYTIIEEAVDGLVKDRLMMEEMAKQQKPLIEAASLRLLLLPGSEPYDPELTAAAGIDLERQSYVVALIALEPVRHSPFDVTPADFNRNTAFVKNRFMAALGENVLFLDLDVSHVAAILLAGGEPGGHDRLKSTLEAIHEEIVSKQPMILHICISGLYRGSKQARKAYGEAYHISRWFIAKEGQAIYTMADLPAQSSKFFYPIDMEIRLVQTVRRGDVEEVKGILKEIYEQNFDKITLSESMKHQLMHAMRNTVARGLKEFIQEEEIHSIFRELDAAISIDQIFNSFIRANLLISQRVNEKKAPSVSKLENRMIAYIHQHYGDADLTIHTISEHFQMSDQQMYHFFRENIGQTYADFLESVRMQAACELLRKGNTTVKEIAKLTGYTSDVSFRRAFKRVISMSPSDYMKTL